MAQGNCVECAAEGRERITALVLDGAFVCATHAAKIRTAGKVAPHADPGEVEPAAKMLCKRGCGREPHPGGCPGNHQAYNANPAVLPAAVPATEIVLEGKPKTAPASPDGEFRLVPKSAVPVRVSNAPEGYMDRLLKAAKGATAEQAVEITCQDAKAAKNLTNLLGKKATRHGIQLRTRTSDKLAWIWVQPKVEERKA